VLAQLGELKLHALATFAGILGGTFAFGWRASRGARSAEERSRLTARP
jgi:hypothetical protein